ncbi:unnamed protein product [Zymoseptoria tritici ST99CH_1E4]|uniref:Mediator of RNA polymerase II transcription subunit 9 n=1 Tax=Zymoseptoria tritici ST99CH_1E4 TaxID=1276532 RepID=A0A2H1H3M3_ZYMTR|nr:unnamed protein product [Zymoseptoria tritici ST99CH_1E4]
MAHPIKTTTNLTPASPLLALPPPGTFDILPTLHELLSRVALQQTDPNLQTANSNLSDSVPEGTSYIGLSPLAPKDLPTAVLEVKAKIRAALRAVEGLPDVERSLEEQDEEIAELEERIRRQRIVLSGLQDVKDGKVGGMG